VFSSPHYSFPSSPAAIAVDGTNVDVTLRDALRRRAEAFFLEQAPQLEHAGALGQLQGLADLAGFEREASSHAPTSVSSSSSRHPGASNA
jgi:hypothetical protein